MGEEEESLAGRDDAVDAVNGRKEEGKLLKPGTVFAIRREPWSNA